MERLMGIDFGSKLAGTTVVCVGKLGEVPSFFSSRPKQDADVFLREMIAVHHPNLIAMDAPLSLPAVYTLNPKSNDYFYREADRTLKAMSPMFLGGLTARAIQLLHHCNQQNIQMFETYPAALVRELGLQDWYDKKSLAALPDFCTQLGKIAKFKTSIPGIPNWHHADALLAWVSCCRMVTHTNCSVGNVEEGVICF
jgi:predicted nuclease with RNAse H fold